MKWSINAGKIFGIQLRIHLTFFLLLLFAFAAAYNERGFNAGVMSALFICAIFTCVVIHEVGHSLIARRFGKEAKSITLLPIGGMATVEEMPKKPLQEIAVALVGPMINLVIAGVLYILVGRETGVSIPIYIESGRAFVSGLIGVNIMLAIFNLIPAFPMDGGRVLRAILALKFNYLRATSLAVGIGQAISVFFIFFGLISNWWLTIIGIFLYLGAGGEKQQVVLQSLLAAVPVREAMTTEYISLRPEDSLVKALEHFHHGSQQDFPVIGDDGIAGILTRDRILASIHTRGVDTPVSEVMDRSFIEVSPKTGLDEVYKQLMSNQKTAAVVIENGQLAGMLCLDGISRYFMVRAALKGVDTENFSAGMRI